MWQKKNSPDQNLQTLTQGIHTFCREDQYRVRRRTGFTQLLQGSLQITALCPDATTSRKFPVQTAASNRHLSFLPPTGALQQVSVFCPWLTWSRFVRTCYILLQKLFKSQCVKKITKQHNYA